MHGYISDLHWVMLERTYLLQTILIPYVESHTWLNTKNLTSCVFPNVSSESVVHCVFVTIYD